MNKIQTELLPQLESRFRVNFPTPELILLALSCPSVRNIFEDLETHFKDQATNPLKPEEYTELAASGDATNVLALIGDSALDLAVVQVLWDSSLGTVGALTNKRNELHAHPSFCTFETLLFIF